MSKYDIIVQDVQSVAPVFARMVGGQNADAKFEAEAGFAIQILTASEYAMGIATSNRQSVIDAVTNVAAIGITLNPAKKQAYLVPRDGRICLDISYMGLMDMAIDDGGVCWAQCHLVHEADSFELLGVDKAPHHGRNPFSRDRGPIVGVYTVVKTPSGDYLTHAMAIDDVYAIRDRSSAWKAYKSKGKSCPWVTDEGEMVKKTCVKQACKYWPRTAHSKLETAIEYLNRDMGEGIEIEQKKQDLHIPGSQAGRDMLQSMSIEDQEFMRKAAADICARHAAGNDDDAFDAYTLAMDGREEEGKAALWTLLDSKTRSAIKRVGKALADQAKAAA